MLVGMTEPRFHHWLWTSAVHLGAHQGHPRTALLAQYDIEMFGLCRKKQDALAHKSPITSKGWI